MAYYFVDVDYKDESLVDENSIIMIETHAKTAAEARQIALVELKKSQPDIDPKMYKLKASR